MNALAVAPSDPDTIYAATDLGLARSRRRRRPLAARVARRQAPFRWTVVVDPERAETVYVRHAGPAEGVLRSTDGGRTWRPFGARLPRHGVQHLAFDPSGTWLYAGTNDAGLTSIRVR